MEKVKNFQRNYLESEKFFSNFSPKPKSENFQGKWPKSGKSKKISTKVEKVKKFQRNYLESEKFFPKFSKGKISKT